STSGPRNATWCRSRSADRWGTPTLSQRGKVERIPSMASLMEQFAASSHLFGANAPFVEELYERYLADPSSVDPEWRAQFDAWQKSGNGKDVPHGPIVAAFEN